MTRIGNRRHVLTFERRTAGLDAFRQPTDEWATLGTAWAEVRNLSGRELATAREVRPEVTSRITIHAGEVPGLTSEDRVDFGGRRLQILSVIDPDERGRDVYIDACEWKDAT